MSRSWWQKVGGTSLGNCVCHFVDVLLSSILKTHLKFLRCWKKERPTFAFLKSHAHLHNTSRDDKLNHKLEELIALMQWRCHVYSRVSPSMYFCHEKIKIHAKTEKFLGFFNLHHDLRSFTPIRKPNSRLSPWQSQMPGFMHYLKWLIWHSIVYF